MVKALERPRRRGPRNDEGGRLLFTTSAPGRHRLPSKPWFLQEVIPPIEGLAQGSFQSMISKLAQCLRLVKVELTKKIKEVLQDPSARKQLQAALAHAGSSGEITVGDKRYELVPLSGADMRSSSAR